MIKSAYHDHHLTSAASLVTGFLLYRNASLLLEEILTPGFFPERSALSKDDLIIVMAGDGWTMVQVTGFDIARQPLVAQATAVDLPLAAEATPATKTRAKAA